MVLCGVRRTGHFSRGECGEAREPARRISPNRKMDGHCACAPNRKSLPSGGGRSQQQHQQQPAVSITVWYIIY